MESVGLLLTYTLFHMHWSCKCKLCLTHGSQKRTHPLSPPSSPHYVSNVAAYTSCSFIHIYHNVFRPSLVCQLSSPIYLFGSKSSIAVAAAAPEYLVACECTLVSSKDHITCIDCDAAFQSSDFRMKCQHFAHKHPQAHCTRCAGAKSHQHNNASIVMGAFMLYAFNKASKHHHLSVTAGIAVGVSCCSAINVVLFCHFIFLT